MSVSTTAVSSELILVLDNGVGALGKPLSKQRTYKNLHPQADPEDVLLVANRLINLQTRGKQAIRRQDTIELEEII